METHVVTGAFGFSGKYIAEKLLTHIAALSTQKRQRSVNLDSICIKFW